MVFSSPLDLVEVWNTHHAVSCQLSPHLSVHSAQIADWQLTIELLITMHAFAVALAVEVAQGV